MSLSDEPVSSSSLRLTAGWAAADDGCGGCKWVGAADAGSWDAEVEAEVAAEVDCGAGPWYLSSSSAVYRAPWYMYMYM